MCSFPSQCRFGFFYDDQGKGGSRKLEIERCLEHRAAVVAAAHRAIHDDVRTVRRDARIGHRRVKSLIEVIPDDSAGPVDDVDAKRSGVHAVLARRVFHAAEHPAIR